METKEIKTELIEQNESADLELQFLYISGVLFKDRKNNTENNLSYKLNLFSPNYGLIDCPISFYISKDEIKKGNEAICEAVILQLENTTNLKRFTTYHPINSGYNRQLDIQIDSIKNDHHSVLSMIDFVEYYIYDDWKSATNWKHYNEEDKHNIFRKNNYVELKTKERNSNSLWSSIFRK
jgi:hypothetical protein